MCRDAPWHVSTNEGYLVETEPLLRAPRPTTPAPLPVLPVTEQGLVLANEPHRTTAVSAVGGQEGEARIEEEAPRAGRAGRAVRI